MRGHTEGREDSAREGPVKASTGRAEMLDSCRVWSGSGGDWHHKKRFQRDSTYHKAGVVVGSVFGVG